MEEKVILQITKQEDGINIFMPSLEAHEVFDLITRIELIKLTLLSYVEANESVSFQDFGGYDYSRPDSMQDVQ